MRNRKSLYVILAAAIIILGTGAFIAYDQMTGNQWRSRASSDKAEKRRLRKQEELQMERQAPERRLALKL